jgi:hypothetical protein
MRVFLFALILLTTGCETMAPTAPAPVPVRAAAPAPTTKFWEPAEGHESLTHDDFARDKWTCLQQTQTTPVYFGSCMEAHGWVKEK